MGQHPTATGRATGWISSDATIILQGKDQVLIDVDLRTIITDSTRFLCWSHLWGRAFWSATPKIHGFDTRNTGNTSPNTMEVSFLSHGGSLPSSRHGSWLVFTPWWRLADSRILPPHQGELRRRWNSFVHRLFGAARITWPLGGSQAWRRWEWWGSYPPKKWPGLTTQKISTTCFSYDILRVITIWHLGIINDDYL